MKQRMCAAPLTATLLEALQDHPVRQDIEESLEDMACRERKEMLALREMLVIQVQSVTKE